MKFILLCILTFIFGCKSVKAEKEILVDISYNAKQEGNVYRVNSKDVLGFALKMKVMNNFRKPMHALVHVIGDVEKVPKFDEPVEQPFHRVGKFARLPNTFEALKHSKCEGCALTKEIKIFQPVDDDFTSDYVINKEYKVEFVVIVQYLKFGSEEYDYEEIKQSFKVIFE